MDSPNLKTPSNLIARVDRLKSELDKLRPLPEDAVGRVAQKLRLEWDYHSNAIEGNSLNLGETKNLILHGLTAERKPLRDQKDMEGHDHAVKAIEEAAKEKLSEVFIRNLHKILLKEPYQIDALSPDGSLVKRNIAFGEYKKHPNNVKTSTGETYYFTPPDQVKSKMSDLIDWYTKTEDKGEHPIILAASFHYRFVRIHPFDDGNGRMARLLMNMILLKHGYTIAIIPTEKREQYINNLEGADKSEDLRAFFDFIGSCCEYSLNLHLKAARGEEIEDETDIDKEIALFKGTVKGNAIPLRDYANTVVYPFYIYCESKLKKFYDMFNEHKGPHVQGEYTAHGKPVKFYNLTESNTDFPQEAFKFSCDFPFTLYNFQARGKSVNILIVNTVELDNYEWHLILETYAEKLHPSSTDEMKDSQSEQELYQGQDLDELKKAFNKILKAMMKYLKSD